MARLGDSSERTIATQVRRPRCVCTGGIVINGVLLAEKSRRSILSTSQVDPERLYATAGTGRSMRRLAGSHLLHVRPDDRVFVTVELVLRSVSGLLPLLVAQRLVQYFKRAIAVSSRSCWIIAFTGSLIRAALVYSHLVHSDLCARDARRITMRRNTDTAA